jgi:ParB/RepB/Spo0J family partition protein
MNAPEPLQESLVDYFPIDKLHPSPTNPRDAIGDVSELATSIARMGVLQPVLIRPGLADGEYEVISGHRRLMAAAVAGLEQVPCRLCEVNDEQVAEIQIVENLQRKDLSPMEEARGYERLQSEFGHSAEQIAGRVGKSRAYVYAKLKLLALHQAGREALAAGQISESVALLVARLPAKLQPKAVKALTQEDYRRDAQSESMPFRQAQRLMAEQFTIDLRKAGWSLDDQTLVEGIGACNQCPKMAKNNPDEYPDITDGRTCMDPTCFAEKRAAYERKLEAQALQKADTKLKPSQVREVLDYSGHVRPSSGLVVLNQKPEGSTKTWNQLAKSAGVEIETIAIVDKERGKVLVAARGEQLREALEAKGLKVADQPQAALTHETTFETARESFEAANEAIAAIAISQLLEAPSVWRAVAFKMVRGAPSYQMKIAQAAGMPELVEHADGWEHGALQMIDAVRDPMMLRRLIAAAAVVAGMRAELDDDASDEQADAWVFHSPDFDRACAEVRIDAPAERARILAERAASKTAAEDVTEPDPAPEQAAPAKPKRKAKAPKPSTEETPKQAGSAGVEHEESAHE